MATGRINPQIVGDVGTVERVVGTALSRSSSQLASTVFVEVGDQGVSAQITRGGATLPTVEVRPEVIGSFLDGLHLVPTKVVTQSVPAGSAVVRGTVIDVVVAAVHDLPLEVIAGIHPALAGFTVAQASEAFLSADVRDILRRRPDPAELTTAEQGTLTAALNARDISVSEEGSNSLTAAYKGLQAALTFTG
jgi:hypothetical protein